jgi:glycosyltransferase involved in cell wall biosynthesis
MAAGHRFPGPCPAQVTTLHILTGEYPPQTGGVADYCAQVASGLAAEGWVVHVWCPGPSDTTEEEPAGVTVHRRSELFGLGGLTRLATALGEWEEPRRLLLQYAPNAFGMRGMNLPLCLWLLARSRRDDVRVMFHEPYFYFGWRRPLRNVLAAVHRLMAVCLLGASRRVYVASATWERYLSPYMWLGARQLMWLPVPSTVPAVADDEAIAACRLAHRVDDALVVGHFGTYGEQITPLVARCFAELADRRPALRFLCLGRNSDRFVAELESGYPVLQHRVTCAADIAADEIGAHLRVCDLVVQPFVEGVTSRRTSLMAALANGRPTVTTAGPLTEEIWAEDGGVAMAPAGDDTALVDLADALLEDPVRRAALGRDGQRLYDTRFALRHVLHHLTDQPDNPVPPR